VANALINTREAVTSAYKFGARFGGPVTGAAMAAVALAAQMANVKAIASQSFGGGGDSGGGSSSSGGGSSSTGAGSGGADAASSTSTQQSTAKTVTIALEGGDNSSYSKKQVRELIKQINDAVGDGARLRVA
jgi:membrane protein involved in colicin uptake